MQYKTIEVPLGILMIFKVLKSSGSHCASIFKKIPKAPNIKCLGYNNVSYNTIGDQTLRNKWNNIELECVAIKKK